MRFTLGFTLEQLSPLRTLSPRYDCQLTVTAGAILLGLFHFGGRASGVLAASIRRASSSLATVAWYGCRLVRLSLGVAPSSKEQTAGEFLWQHMQTPLMIRLSEIDPLRAVQARTVTGHDKVNVRMMAKPLVPSVKYACTGRLNTYVRFDLGLEKVKIKYITAFENKVKIKDENKGHAQLLGVRDGSPILALN